MNSRDAILLASACITGIASALFPVHRASSQEKVTLKATPEALAWGYYDAKAKPALRIKSADTAQIEMLIMSSRET